MAARLRGLSCNKGCEESPLGATWQAIVQSYGPVFESILFLQ